MQDVLLELPRVLKPLFFDSQLTLQLIHHSGVLIAAQCLTHTAQHNTVLSAPGCHTTLQKGALMIYKA
jgi:hypothetical protein